ncbi:hypothetical protein WMY93_005696 [Mugilogobius chulae]|uniref:Uncharacterized protein n=1 Tax=Mugilogobius chulae TaxID=88201 RepID=A0AAW0PKB6_9GOBI
MRTNPGSETPQPSASARKLLCRSEPLVMKRMTAAAGHHRKPGNLTPVRDSPAIPRLRSVNSYTNIRAATTARNLNKSLQNLNLNEEGGQASPLSTSSSTSSTLGSPDNDEYILSFETIDKMRRVSSYSSLNSLIELSAWARLWRDPIRAGQGQKGAKK